MWFSHLLSTQSLPLPHARFQVSHLPTRRSVLTSAIVATPYLTLEQYQRCLNGLLPVASLLYLLKCRWQDNTFRFFPSTREGLRRTTPNMRVLTSALAFAALPALALTATIPTKRDNTIPDISGMSTVFSGTFEGDSGDGVDSSVWNIATCK